MVKTNYYSGLNPIVVQALNNLQYRYSGETPEMWCFRVRYLFKKLLEYNPKYFSKNGFIQMIERVYIDGDRAPNGSGWVGSTALPDPKLRVGSGNGSERVRRVLNLTNQ